MFLAEREGALKLVLTHQTILSLAGALPEPSPRIMKSLASPKVRLHHRRLGCARGQVWGGRDVARRIFLESSLKKLVIRTFLGNGQREGLIRRLQQSEREMCPWAISKYSGDLVSNTSA
jgi:hypothetical protein